VYDGLFHAELEVEGWLHGLRGVNLTGRHRGPSNEGWQVLCEAQLERLPWCYLKDETMAGRLARSIFLTCSPSKKMTFLPDNNECTSRTSYFLSLSSKKPKRQNILFLLAFNLFPTSWREKEGLTQLFIYFI